MCAAAAAPATPATPGLDQALPHASPDTTPSAPGRPAGGQPAHGAAPGSPLCIPSERLFGGAQEVQISHHGMRYRLKKTALGKLILTK